MRFDNFEQEQEFNHGNSNSSEYEQPWNTESTFAEASFAVNELEHQTQEMELATELLGVSNEAELEQFLSGFLSRALGAASSFMRSPAGQQITGLLKSAAKQVLPKIGGAVGGYFGGDTGAQIGGKLAAGAGQLLGLELEGLSGEDREFEVARQYVRFAQDAVSRAARDGATALDARNALRSAARAHAPGLFSPASPSIPASSIARNGNESFPLRGTWIRSGNVVTLS